MQYIPALIPAASATSPVIQGMRIAPLLATGSMMPMLATLVIRDNIAQVLAEAVGEAGVKES